MRGKIENDLQREWERILFGYSCLNLCPIGLDKLDLWKFKMNITILWHKSLEFF